MTTLRILIWFAIAAAAMLAAVWLAERPGTLTAEWQGWRLDTSVGVVAIAIVVLILLGVAGLPLIGLLERSAQRVRGRWLSPEEAKR